MRPPRFRSFTHTADIGVEVRGETLEELFANAAHALLAQVTDLRRVRPRQERVVRASGETREALLVAWLSEIYLLLEGERWLFRRAEKIAMGEGRLEALVRGEPVDLARHRLETEIKAITYHQLRIERRGSEWRTRIVFDV